MLSDIYHMDTRHFTLNKLLKIMLVLSLLWDSLYYMQNNKKNEHIN